MTQHTDLGPGKGTEADRDFGRGGYEPLDAVMPIQKIDPPLLTTIHLLFGTT
jgi:hypothetical protein